MTELMLGPMPAIGFGTWPLAGDKARRAVAEAIAVGYRAIDTAQAYGNETEVGAGIRDSGIARSDIFVTTKVWPDRLAAGEVGPAVEESLDRLGIGPADLVLVHWPNPEVPVTETLHALDAVRRAGRTKLIGVSNFTTRLLAEAVAVGVPLFCNQVEFHPFLDQRKILAATRAAGLYLVAYSPLARGRVGESETLKAIGRKYGKSAAQVALRWIVEQDGVGYAAKASSPARMKENRDIANFSLTAEEMAAISALADGTRVVNLAIAPAWD